MRTELKQKFLRHKGLAVPLLVLCMVIIMLLGIGMLAVSYGARLNSIRIANRAVSMLAAEAGYEKAIFWLSQQTDVAYVLKNGGAISDSLNLTNSSCDYNISFYSYLGSRPAYKITSTGYAGSASKTVEVVVLQQIGGWDMGLCRVPNGTDSTTPVYFASNEVIDVPLHINKLKDSPDQKDIYISGTPRFIQNTSVGELRYSSGSSDKYASVMNLFEGGIDFGQPSNRITNEAVVQTKVNRFKTSTKDAYRFKPEANASIPNPVPATQIEFFVVNGVGKFRVTDNCTVRGFSQSTSGSTWDLKIRPGTKGQNFDTYEIYSYHLISSDAVGPIYNVTDSYVTQSIAGIESEPGGQIFVDGNVIIGGDLSDHNDNQVLNGKITIVATGNIWIADSIILDGPHNEDGKPSEDNPNALGLIAQGVIKVVDPGMSDYSYVDDSPVTPAGYTYVPIGIPDTGYSSDSYMRHLPDPLTIEASITVGGGGFGAENVERGSYGDRKEENGNQDNLILRGTITEAIRGVVGLIGSEGYVKNYYFDKRVLKGILPGDIWLRGKYTAAPDGWKEY